VGDAQLLPERPGCRWVCKHPPLEIFRRYPRNYAADPFTQLPLQY
jgi:hypothetical protein